MNNVSDMMIPEAVAASFIETEPLDGGEHERFLLLRFEGRFSTYQVLLSRAGTSRIAANLTESIQNWDLDRT